MTGDSEGWAGWSQERERARKETAEAWAKEVFGREMEVKPYELEGAVIVPFEQHWDTARRAKFPWGEITSYFDGKAGFSGMAIQYSKTR
jgi:hypothetical protein